jgi:hypothetical protein
VTPPPVPPAALPLTARLLAAAQADERIRGVALGGSAVGGAIDAFSDVDAVIVCADDALADLLAAGPAFAGGLGPLLAAFTGEHVGEPRLLVCLFGAPLLHVDLKFVGVSDLPRRIEDPVVLWERDGAVTAALDRSPAVWPSPDAQWIEDRFWVWIHYAAAKVGRGELFECLDSLAAIRALVLGPLLAQRAGQRPQRVRRLEQQVPEWVPALRATIGNHSAAGCVEALRAAIALYRGLREPGVRRCEEAEAASVAYLDTMAEAIRAHP